MKKFIICLILAHTIFAADYLQFVANIQKKCSLDNTLIIKKTYLSLLKNSKDCNSSFATALLKSCNNFECNDLIDEFYLSQKDGKGNVIGGRE